MVVMTTPVTTVRRSINRRNFDNIKEYRQEVFELMYIEVREKELQAVNA